MSYIYTNQINSNSTIDKVSSITLDDIVLLNGNNIATSIDELYEGINPIPSFDIAKGISATASANINDIRDGYFNLSADNVVSGKNKFLSVQNFVSVIANSLSVNSLSSTVFVTDDATFKKNTYAQDISATSLSSTIVKANDVLAQSLSVSGETLLEGKLNVTLSAIIDAEKVSYSETKDLSIGNSLSTDFNHIINTKDEFLSSLHDTNQIKYINNAYRMVDEIIVEADLVGNQRIPNYSNLYKSDWRTLVNSYIKSGIISAKNDVLSGVAGIQEFLNNTDPKVTDVIDVLQVILNNLKISPYSLDKKIKSIENSIDALEVNLADRIDTVKQDTEDNSNEIEKIKTKIDNANCNYTLSSTNKLSVITSVKQLSGKIEVVAKSLTSADVDGLDNYVNTKDQDVKNYVSSTYLPLDGGKINGSIEIENDISVKGNVSNIKIGESDLCTLIKNEIKLSTEVGDSNLSTKIRNSVGFTYDYENSAILLSVAGNELSISTAKFEEAKMLSTVMIRHKGTTPFLQMYFRVVDSDRLELVELPLNEIAPLYHGGDGIDINLNGKNYEISADSTIARKTDIKSLSINNGISGGGYVLKELTQTDGKIAYSVEKLSTSHITGLENYSNITAFATSLSGSSGVISSLSNTVKLSIENLDYDNKDFYGTGADAGEIKVVKSLSQKDGKIDYTTDILKYTEISGLSSTLNKKLDNSGSPTIDGNLSIGGSLSVNTGFTALGGKLLTSGANRSVAIGRNAVANNEESFVWSGADNEYPTYTDHGQHTFNINPVDGLNGVYIGSENLHDTLSALSANTAASTNVKTAAIFKGIQDALSTAGVFGKSLNQITLGHVINSIYELGQLVSRLSNDFN